MSYERPKDLPPPPPYPAGERPLAVHLHPSRVTPGELEGGVVIVIDQLRASVTIAAALAAGAARIIPTLSVSDAMEMKRRMGPGALLGGERGGVRIPGFDLDNSPRSCDPGVLRGRTLVFTTTNGTASLLHARLGGLVLVGSLANLSSVVERVATDPRPVHVLCAGTREEITLEDCLAGGAFVEQLLERGRRLGTDDSGRVCLHAWRQAASSDGGILNAFLDSRGGRNLDRVGLREDVVFCAQADTLAIVPVFSAGARGSEITDEIPGEIPGEITAG